MSPFDVSLTPVFSSLKAFVLIFHLWHNAAVAYRNKMANNVLWIEIL
jgi:hypothetical protein